MPNSRRPRWLWDAYRVPGFRPSPPVRGIFGDPHARILPLTRRPQKRSLGRVQRGWYDRKLGQVHDLGCGGLRIYLEL